MRSRGAVREEGRTLGPLLDAAVRAADASGLGLGWGGKNAQALNSKPDRAQTVALDPTFVS